MSPDRDDFQRETEEQELEGLINRSEPRKHSPRKHRPVPRLATRTDKLGQNRRKIFERAATTDGGKRLEAPVVLIRHLAYSTAFQCQCSFEGRKHVQPDSRAILTTRL